MNIICLGCDRTVLRGKDFISIAEREFPVCDHCQDQLSNNEMALRAALREILAVTR